MPHVGRGQDVVVLDNLAAHKDPRCREVIEAKPRAHRRCREQRPSNGHGSHDRRYGIDGIDMEALQARSTPQSITRITSRNPETTTAQRVM